MILKVVNVSASRQDKNGKNYKTLYFQGPTTKEVDGVRVRIAPKTGAINVYEESYLNGQPEFGWDFQVGTVAEGDIVTRQVDPYNIVDPNTGEITREGVTKRTLTLLGDPSSEEFQMNLDVAFERAAEYAAAQAAGV